MEEVKMKNKQLIEQSSFVFEYQDNNGHYKVIKDRLGDFEGYGLVHHTTISEYLQSSFSAIVLDVNGELLHSNF